MSAIGVRIDPLGLPGLLHVPPGADAVVLFVHGSGCSRLSPRNGRVAAALRQRGLGTLLFDLLTEADDRRRVFDIPLLAGRLAIPAPAWRTVPVCIGNRRAERAAAGPAALSASLPTGTLR